MVSGPGGLYWDWCVAAGVRAEEPDPTSTTACLSASPVYRPQPSAARVRTDQWLCRRFCNFSLRNPSLVPSSATNPDFWLHAAQLQTHHQPLLLSSPPLLGLERRRWSVLDREGRDKETLIEVLRPAIYSDGRGSIPSLKYFSDPAPWRLGRRMTSWKATGPGLLIGVLAGWGYSARLATGREVSGG